MWWSPLFVDTNLICHDGPSLIRIRHNDRVFLPGDLYYEVGLLVEFPRPYLLFGGTENQCRQFVSNMYWL